MVIDTQNLPFHILFYDILLLYVLLRLVTFLAFLVSVLEVLHHGVLLCISSKLHIQRCGADSSESGHGGNIYTKDIRKHNK